MSDSLTHQEGGSHYKDMAIQPVEFIHKNNIPFIEGCVIKYVCRHRRKNGKEDIKKAIHFLEILLEKEYSGESQWGNIDLGNTHQHAIVCSKCGFEHLLVIEDSKRGDFYCVCGNPLLKIS